MQWSHRKHYTSLPRSALGLPKLRIEPRTERAKPHILAHVVTITEAAAMLDCFPGEIEALVENHALVGRNIKTARGRMWIVCAACVADFQTLPLEERQTAVATAPARAAAAPTSMRISHTPFAKRGKMPVKKQLMTPEHPLWDEFVERLSGPEGCDVRKDENGKFDWERKGGRDKSKTRAILATMPGIDVKGSLAFFDAQGGHCDCEILFNIAD